MLLLVLAAVTAVQEIGWEPAAPRQGSLIVVSAADAVTGEVAVSHCISGPGRRSPPCR